MPLIALFQQDFKVVNSCVKCFLKRLKSFPGARKQKSKPSGMLYTHTARIPASYCALEHLLETYGQSLGPYISNKFLVKLVESAGIKGSEERNTVLAWLQRGNKIFYVSSGTTIANRSQSDHTGSSDTLSSKSNNSSLSKSATSFPSEADKLSVGGGANGTTQHVAVSTRRHSAQNLKTFDELIVLRMDWIAAAAYSVVAKFKASVESNQSFDSSG